MSAVGRVILSLLVLMTMAAVAPGQTLGPTAPWDETPAQSTLGPSLWAPPARPNPASLLGDAVSLFARASDVQGGAVTNGAATADASVVIASGSFPAVTAGTINIFAAIPSGVVATNID